MIIGGGGQHMNVDRMISDQNQSQVEQLEANIETETKIMVLQSASNMTIDVYDVKKATVSFFKWDSRFFFISSQY